MNEIKMVSVKSSQIKSIGYDAETCLLYIEFLNGVVYQYGPVDVKIYNDMLVPTVSVGKYFYAFIKGQFAYKKTDYNVLFGKLREAEGGDL